MTLPFTTLDRINAPDFDLADATEVYGDNVIEMFPEIDVPCPAAEGMQCIYDATAQGIEHIRCRRCGRLTG